VRRHHLAGSLGAAVLARIFRLGWARRARHSRVVIFSSAGQAALRRRFGSEPCGGPWSQPCSSPRAISQ
jgi:hypothetical protein